MGRETVSAATQSRVSETMSCGYLAVGSSGHIHFSLCLCIFIIMDFIAVNNS